MSQTLNTALEQVKLARVQVFPRSVRKQINLFEEDMSTLHFQKSDKPIKSHTGQSNSHNFIHRPGICIERTYR